MILKIKDDSHIQLKMEINKKKIVVTLFIENSAKIQQNPCFIEM
jgi:hypothetical protein